jgi:ABC-2 type transport system ATP-binding protein
MNDYVIETEALIKKFGRQVAVDGVDLRVPRGSVYGFLGRNGAGKTTTIKMLLGLLPFKKGTGRVFGLNSRKHGVKIRQITGYVPERHHMYGWMKIKEIVKFVSRFYPTWDHEYAESLLDRFKLPRDKKIKSLSRGMEAKVALTLALAHRPELLVLDDPTMGLDSIVRKEFLESIVQVIQEEGRTVFFSSHIIEEVERVADHVAIISEGRLKVQKPLDELKKSMKRIRLIFSDGVPESDLFGTEDILKREVSDREIMLTVNNFSPEFTDQFRIINPSSVEVHDLTLDEMFFALEA